ncbi:MAG: ribosomal protein S18-alanine N-acetyltransferase [Wenzhouxiangellaceae bacterium]
MATVPKHRVIIRAMTPADLDEVTRVEAQAYEFPWNRNIFADCLRVGYICRLIELGDAVVGHMILSVAAGEAHLLNLCIAPDIQGRGLGRRLLSHAMNAARVGGAERMILEVRPSNWRALRLYQAAGFESIGRRRGYYPAGESREDALVLAHSLRPQRLPRRRHAPDDD